SDPPARPDARGRRMSFIRPTLLLLAATVAASSACVEKPAPPSARSSALADSADQVMFGAHLNLTDAGLSRAELLADTAYFFHDNTRIELRQVETSFSNTREH